MAHVLATVNQRRHQKRPGQDVARSLQINSDHDLDGFGYTGGLEYFLIRPLLVVEHIPNVPYEPPVLVSKPMGHSTI